MEQELTDTNTANADLLLSNDEENSNVSIDLTSQMVQNAHITKWKDPTLEISLKIQ